MKKMNVLQLIDSLNVGGAEVMAVNIHNLLCEDENINSYICATRKEGNLRSKINNNNTYFFLNKKSVVDIKAIVKLLTFIKQNKIKIVHAHSSSYFTAFCAKFFMPTLKIIWHDHYGLSDELVNRKKQPLKFISKYFSYSIFVNQSLLEWAKLNLRVKKIIFLPNFGRFELRKGITILKGLPEKRIIKLAAFRAQKDHLNALKSFYLISKTYKEWTLHLVGGHLNDAYFAEIKKFIKEKELTNKVFFYGVCLDVQYLLSQATIGVLSSKSEGLPISLLEYGLAKIPVVVTNVGYSSKVVENNLSGFVVEKEDSVELANAIAKLIDSKKKRLSFGHKLYEEVSTNYSEKKFIENLLKIYKSII